MCNSDNRNSRDRFAGIRRALEAAMRTRQCVTVGLNPNHRGTSTTTTSTTTGGREIEGIIISVRRNSFTIQFENTSRSKTFPIAEVEYVEFG